jgi:pimeloyl-ACP methyl ester carboxylesterase
MARTIFSERRLLGSTSSAPTLEIARWEPDAVPTHRSTLVLLHEGLGCVGLLRDWPGELADRTRRAIVAYSRLGYGASDPVPLPRPLDYMEREASGDLPAVLDALALDDVVLVGHSDGASIALVHAALDAARPTRRVRGIVLLAPHLFAEDLSIASIARARDAFANGDLRARLARWHGANVDCAFRGWNDAWLDPAFRSWNLEPFVPRIACPILVLQGAADEYGTLAQVHAIERAARVPVTTLVLPGCGHAPQKDARAETNAAIVAFVARLATSS